MTENLALCGAALLVLATSAPLIWWCASRRPVDLD